MVPNTKQDKDHTFFPRARSLRVTVTLTILIPIVIVLSVSTILEYTRHRQRDLDSMSLIASQTGQVIEQILRREMLNSDFDAIQAIFDSIGSEAFIVRLNLLTPSGRVVFSPQGIETGSELNNTDPSCQPCHSHPPAKRPTGVIASLGDGTEIFRSMQPVLNEPACNGCHSADQRILGLLLTDLSISPVQSTLAADLQENIFWWVGTGLAMIILANMAINRTVLVRIQRLARAMEGISVGRATNKLEEEPMDEIGRLSAGFNRMADSIIARASENQQLSADLQTRVDERAQLLKQLIHSQEDERVRVARELHDDLGQRLSGINFQVGLAQRFLGEDPSKAEPLLDKARTMLSETTDRIYEVILQLRPSILDDLGLAPALRNLAQRSFGPAGIHYAIHIDGFSAPLSSEVETAIFRIFQEAVTNILRHAKAQRVTLNLHQLDGLILGQIEDDGQGMGDGPRHQSRGSGGFGLLGMRERAELVGGWLRIEDVSPHGTRVMLEIPHAGSGAHE